MSPSGHWASSAQAEGCVTLITQPGDPGLTARRILCPGTWLLSPILLPSRVLLNLGPPPLCQQDPVSILPASSEGFTGRKGELGRAEHRQGILKTVILANSGDAFYFFILVLFVPQGCDSNTWP